MTTDPRAQEITTGLSDFDDSAGPIPRGHVTVVAGRSSAGTTAFVMSVARHNDEVGRQVSMASFESGTDTLMNNLVAATTSVNMDRPLSIGAGRRARIDRARPRMEQSRLTLWSSQLNAGRWPFQHLIEQLDALPDLDLLIVDGYGLASYGEPAEGATFAVLKDLARVRGAAVLVTCHLTPEAGTPEAVLPTLSELMPLDAPVAEAETAVILHRPDRGSDPQRRGEVDLIAVCGWQGAGSATVRFEPEYHRFVDLPNT
ncbi:DnaB-like helicase C-terminal domain-containing protein [Streptomyces scabiei]|uniref:DnaB-like helicase C-terminal domain-containing protein n=1 Tax=Streptomyces scabiei TaxID=1930 RepID=UPI0029B8CC83|nr:DnaB-like helicase C-terminal domain-containing protein [Streptomyces scabiei]MDX3208462.1 DnaB-like helicase C-terminal domain-containing protein [Streptomyces scabiei]